MSLVIGEYSKNKQMSIKKGYLLTNNYIICTTITYIKFEKKYRHIDFERG